ncbi:MAG: hypothetical protein HY064_04895 [Bacteroidetes bacterium]|nr:hypothetical protein [Bacteroidota bacterium]
MRSLLLLLFLLPQILAAQSRPLNEKEKIWLDSVYQVLGKPANLSTYFGDRMKNEGTVNIYFSQTGDTSFSFSIDLYPNGLVPDDGEHYIAFSYDTEKKLLSTGYCLNIYLLPEGPVFFYLNCGGFTNSGIHGATIYSLHDTIFNCGYNNVISDTAVPSPWSPGKYLLFCNGGNASEILQVIVGKKEKKFHRKYSYGENGILVNCILDSFVSYKNYIYPKFQRGSSMQLLFTKNDFGKIHTGDTLLVSVIHFFKGDSTRIYDYAIVNRVFPFSYKRVEEIVEFRESYITGIYRRLSFHVRLTFNNGESQKGNHVFRYLRRKKIFSIPVY